MDEATSLRNVHKQDFVVLEADGQRFSVRKSTLIGANQPAAYGNTPEIAFFSMLLKNQSKFQSLAETSPDSVGFTNAVGFTDVSKRIECRKTPDDNIVCKSQLGKRKRQDDVGCKIDSDSENVILLDKTSDNDCESVQKTTTTNPVGSGNTITFRLDLDPDSLSVIVKYLRGYPIFPGTWDLCLRHCVSRDADMLGIIGLVQEIQQYEESLADSACTMSASEPCFLKRGGSCSVLDELGLKFESVEFWLKYMHEQRLRILLPTKYKIHGNVRHLSYDTFAIDCHGLLFRTPWLSVCPIFTKRGLPYVVPVKNNPKFVGWIGRHWKETTSKDYSIQHETTNAWTVRFYCSSENNMSDEFRQIELWHSTVYDNLGGNKLLSSLFSRDRKWQNKMWLCSRGDVKSMQVNLVFIFSLPPYLFLSFG